MGFGCPMQGRELLLDEATTPVLTDTVRVLLAMRRLSHAH